jgi:hypothetical protein
MAHQLDRAKGGIALQATQQRLHPTGDTVTVGTVVTSGQRSGVVESAPFTVPGDRRPRVWVDYTASVGAVGIDYVRELTVVSSPS